MWDGAAKEAASAMIAVVVGLHGLNCKKIVS